MGSLFRRAFDEALQRGLHVPLSGRAGQRASLAFSTFLGSNVDPQNEPTEPEMDGGLGFVSGHVIGEREAFRRAAVALSDPRARGVERDVLAGLEAGLDIEDAIRKASAPPDTPERGDAASNVIPFSRKSK